MVRRIFPLLIAMACAQAALAQQASAQQRDPAPGRRIAERDCAACHEVRPGETGPSPRPSAPPFQLVARMPSTTELSLRVFLRTSHAGMPNLQFSESEMDDLVAYLMSLSPPDK
jgi:mono/diheme cytochrome c family protein